MRALTRPVSASMTRCELTHLAREPIDIDRARRQHAAYEAALVAAGARVTPLPGADEQPDAVFVEDVLVVAADLAVLTRPGAASRRAELEGIAAALPPDLRVARLTVPATLDGGDVLQIGRTCYVGRSARTNAEGVSQLAALLAPLGIGVEMVVVSGCLHLKSAVTRIDEHRVLLNPGWVDARRFAHCAPVAVDPDEPFAANALLVGDTVIYSTRHVRTADRLTRDGVRVNSVDVSEMEKAEGAVTCCCVLLR